MIHAIDRLVRRRSGVFEFCENPDCLFRVSVGIAAYPLHVPGGEIPAGERILELHFWNEHIPPLPSTGPSLSWAVRFRRLVAVSTHCLAQAMRNDPRLAGVRAVGGVTPLFTPGDGSAAEGIFRRLGFAVTPHRNPLGRFMEFWEEVYAWLLMWTFTGKNQKRPSLRTLRRSDFWMSADRFLRLYGDPPKKGATDATGQCRANQWWKQLSR